MFGDVGARRFADICGRGERVAAGSVGGATWRPATTPHEPVTLCREIKRADLPPNSRPQAAQSAPTPKPRPRIKREAILCGVLLVVYMLAGWVLIARVADFVLDASLYTSSAAPLPR
jgi:hypothetical protein